MEYSASDVFDNTYRQPTGRRLFAMSQVEERAAEVGAADVATLAQRSIAHDLQLRDMEVMRNSMRKAVHGEGAVALDNVMDNCIAGFEGYLINITRIYPPEHELHQSAARLLEVLFPNGSGAITMQPFVQQHVDTNRLVADARSPELAADVARLPGARAMLDELEARNEEYGEVLMANKGPSAEDVREMRARGHELMLETLAAIIAHHALGDSDDPRGRDYLLEPIMQQNEALREARRHRRAPADIDGDDHASDIDSDAGADAGAESARDSVEA